MSARSRWSLVAVLAVGGVTVAACKVVAGERVNEAATPVIMGTMAPVATVKAAANQPAVIPEARAHEAVAVFAGGCFWCVETAFEPIKGVAHVTSGFIGGHRKNATYDEVSSGGTGHAEAVRVVYDPKQVSYEKLLDVFWHNIDPVSAGGQFCDRGDQYRSAIFYGDAAEKKAAIASKRAMQASGRFQKKIATEIVRAGEFIAAEEYHQDFYKKDPVRYYSYRKSCGRDARLKEIGGDEAPKH